MQLLFAWSGLAFTLLFAVGFWPLAQFVPPPAPNMSAAEIVAKYQTNNTRLCLGLLVMMLSTGLVLPFITVISMQIKRMEESSGILSRLQLLSGGLSVMFFIIPCVCWGAAAFRPDRSPQLIMLMNDLGWMSLLMTVSTFAVQNFAIGFAILRDKNAQPVYPRWMGYFTLWVGVSFIPGVMLIFFKTGPFAWDGLFSFWLPFVAFFVWFQLMFVFLRKGIIEQAAAARAGIK
jgi:hypothetical protein